MKLTLKQRLLVYKKLLKVVCEDPRVDRGMCYYLSTLLDKAKKMPKGWKYLIGTQKMDLLPELSKYGRSVYWAPRTTEGWETRIGWIEQAIIDVKKKIK